MRQLERLKTQFLNTAAHEIGTPLTPIKRQLHRLRTAFAGGLDENQRHAVEILDRNVGPSGASCRTSSTSRGCRRAGSA